jgi:transcriptional regulator with XRE-family HTH domain
MNHNASLKNLHIGKIVKEIAQRKGISSKQIAAIIHYGHNNADKIFKMEDMNINDVVTISYLLKYNILDLIAQKYLSHLPLQNYVYDEESFLFKVDMRTQRITSYETFNNCDFLKNINLGEHVRKIAEEKGYTEQDMAKRLHCAQSTICHLYKRESLKIKTIITISNLLGYHFIAELYLFQMVILSSMDLFDDCMIAITSQQVRIFSPNSNNLLMIFQKNDTKKKKRNRRKSDNEP